mgnify:CR=1 FL=1
MGFGDFDFDFRESGLQFLCQHLANRIFCVKMACINQIYASEFGLKELVIGAVRGHKSITTGGHGLMHKFTASAAAYSDFGNGFATIDIFEDLGTQFFFYESHKSVKALAFHNTGAQQAVRTALFVRSFGADNLDVLKAKCSDATKLALLKDFDRVLSLKLLSAAENLRKKQAEEEAANADPEIDALVAARTAAKKEKNWAEADRIRDELKARGIEIIDTPQGAKWKRV